MLFTAPLLPIVLGSLALAAAPARAEVGIKIHPNGKAKKCLDVKDTKFANNTPVQIFDCNGTPAQKWVLHQGETKVRLANTKFCLDAGSHPGDFTKMKIFTCIDKIPVQDWFYTTDNRIALTGKGLCLDLPNGATTNGNRIQTFKCTDLNTNQIWTTPIKFKPELPSDDAAQPVPEPQVHWEIHPNGSNKKCIDVRDGHFAEGTVVQIFDCNETPAQRWVIHRGDTQVHVKGHPFCFAAVTNSIGIHEVLLWTCDIRDLQQHWFYTDDNRIALKDQDQCLDLPSHMTNGTPLHTFHCIAGDTRQIWTTTPPIPPSLGLDTQSFRVQGDKSGFCA